MRFLTDAELEDVATLYLGLAEGTDDQFHFRELQKMEALLSRWSGKDNRSDFVDLLESTITRLSAAGDNSHAQIDGAIERLAQSFSDDEKRKVLSDLSQLGLADHRFLHAEAVFIQRVADAWRVQLLKGLDNSWSILGSGGIQSEALRALGLLSLSIAFEPDGQIGDEERTEILNKLGQWVPDASEDEVELALRDSLAVFATRPPAELIESSVQTVKRLVPEHQHRAIFDDLRSVAMADRVIEVEESTWLSRLSKALGLTTD